MTQPNRTVARNAVLTALERLRAVFPLEARLATADEEIRRGYVEVLEGWRQGAPPLPDQLDAGARAALLRLDAITLDDHGIGCYPFSARDTGIRVQFANHTVFAMCAIDALAIARLVSSTTRIDSTCEACKTMIQVRMEADGSLDHDQVELAQVTWLAGSSEGGSCSEHLCRRLRFLCPHCRPPAGSDGYTLPQAAAIGNAFFGFQRALLQAAPGRRA